MEHYVDIRTIRNILAENYRNHHQKMSFDQALSDAVRKGLCNQAAPSSYERTNRFLGRDEFIDLMHHAGYTPSVIMVTSANDSGIVTSLLSRGVTDYLVKPFEYDRFRDALLRFDRLKKQRKSSQDIFDQEEIDRLIRGSGPEKPSPVSREQLAKGLNQATLDTIRGFLSDHREDSFTCDQIARKVSLSRITVRRYVNYLLEQREVVSSIDYQTGGRPGMYYRYTGK